MIFLAKRLDWLHGFTIYVCLIVFLNGHKDDCGVNFNINGKGKPSA